MLLNDCVNRAKNVLLSLSYPCKDVITPVQDELSSILNSSSETFAFYFWVYLFDELNFFGSGSEDGFNGWVPYENSLEKLSYIDTDDLADGFRVYLKKRILPNPAPLDKLLQRLS